MGGSSCGRSRGQQAACLRNTVSLRTFFVPLCRTQELMQQASWNLCPAGDSRGCYWGTDQAFEQLTGSASVVVPDVPDGGWQTQAVFRA